MVPKRPSSRRNSHPLNTGIPIFVGSSLADLHYKYSDQETMKHAQIQHPLDLMNDNMTGMDHVMSTIQWSKNNNRNCSSCTGRKVHV